VKWKAEAMGHNPIASVSPGEAMGHNPIASVSPGKKMREKKMEGRREKRNS
jgi:hypothetical protein